MEIPITLLSKLKSHLIVCCMCTSRCVGYEATVFRNVLWSSWEKALTLGRKYRPIRRAACEACSATWNLSTNSAFALGPRKTTDNLDRIGRSQDLPDTKLTSSQ
jgi:hypothetical protein